MLLTDGLSSLNVLPELERKLFARAHEETEGKLTIQCVAEWGECSQHQARKLQNTWALRGWIAKDGSRDNSYCLTSKVLELIANQQAPQTSANRVKPTQTQ